MGHYKVKVPSSMHIVYQTFLWALFVAAVTAPPIPDGTGQRSWVPGSTGRGTFDLLKTCIITLVLCVWTAIHPNVILNVTPLKSLGVKVSWMLYGLLSPEMLLSYSLVQMIEAARLRKEWCEHFEVKPGSKQDLMGMRGAFFVVMGGVTLGPRDCLGRYPKTLDKDSFMDLTRQGTIPRNFLDRRTIEDKSKADALAKIVVCVQASWMLVQCTVRTAIGLPLTLLEFHVVVQVVCTVIMYGLWWYKPLNVNEPIPLTDYRQSGVLRFFYFEQLVVGVMHDQPEPGSLPTPPSGSPPPSEEPPHLPNDELFLRLGSKVDGNLLPIHHLPTKVIFTPMGDTVQRLLQSQGPNPISPTDNLTILHGESLVVKNNFFISLASDNGTSIDQSKLQHIRQRVQELRHQKLETDEMSFREMLHDFCCWMALPLTKKVKLYNASQGQGLSNLFYDFLNYPYGAGTTPNNQPRWMVLVPPAVTLVYGISHCIVWDHNFLTEAEKWVWRISSVIAPFALCPLLVFLVVMVYIGMRVPDRYWVRDTLGMLAIVLVPLAGACLIIVSFISLRNVPDGVYKNVPFERYWPHF